MRRLSMTVAALILVLCNSITAEDWRTITPDVIYGHKAGMALTYDVVRPAKDPNAAAVLFMVSGGSAGGHLSLVLGTMGDDGTSGAADPVEKASSRVQAVVAYFPPTDMREYVNHATLSKQFPAVVFPEEQAVDASPLLSVTKDDAPTLLIHGDKDQLVPISHSERFRDAMTKEAAICELIVMHGAAHGFSGDQGTQAETALLDWFDKHLAKPADAK